MIVYGKFEKVKETEKAYLLRYTGDSRDLISKITGRDGFFYGKENGEEFWVPKSIVEEIGDCYIIAKWWKFRNGDLILDGTRWPGKQVRITHSGSLTSHLKVLREHEEELDTRLFKRVLKEEFEVYVDRNCIEIVIPEEVWKSELEKLLSE